jgi:hypothetical protein
MIELPNEEELARDAAADIAVVDAATPGPEDEELKIDPDDYPLF